MLIVDLGLQLGHLCDVINNAVNYFEKALRVPVHIICTCVLRPVRTNIDYYYEYEACRKSIMSYKYGEGQERYLL